MRPLTALLVLLIACKGKVGYERKEVEKTGADLFEKTTGVKPDSFTCPGDDERLLGDLTCTAKVGDDSFDVPTHITTGKDGVLGSGQMEIHPPEYLIDGKKLEAGIVSVYGEKQIQVQAPSCPRLKSGAAGSKWTCKATVNGRPVDIEVTADGKGGTNFVIKDPTAAGPQPGPAGPSNDGEEATPETP